MNPPLLARLMRARTVVPILLLGVSLAELAIADRKYGTFTGGFGQSNAIDTAGEITLFLVGYAVSQIAGAMLLWKLCAYLTRRAREGASLFHFAFAYGGLSAGALASQYQLHSYFSDAVDFALIKQLGGGSLKDALLFSKNEIALGLAALLLFCLVWWACWRLARRFLGERSQQEPGWLTRRKLGAAWFAFLALLALIPRTGSDAAMGLSKMLVWKGAESLATTLTDFDGDGYGLFGLKVDDHPFDARRHPLALDTPGNGIDEDGYGGDLALVPVPKPLPETVVPSDGPNVVMVVFESTRADVLGKRIDGKPVAPNLEALVAEGAGVAPSFSHVAFTTASLKSVFTGKLSPRPGDPSLFRELKQSGYRTGVFSGQPEDFGDISETVGMRQNTDVFVDAEKLKDQRAFSFAAQGSLLIDERILLGEFDRHFGKPEDWARPVLLYFNFQSPHFPYDHPGLPRTLDKQPIARGDISQANRAHVERTYWNAVAYSDAQLGALIARLKRLGVWDRTILMVSGDHGESLFEDGFLGHGHIINQRQFATFLAVNRKLPGMAGPISISDYRGIVLNLLQGGPAAASAPAPFMYIGELDTPSTIGLAETTFGIVSLRLQTGRVCFEHPAHCASYSGLAGEERKAADAVVARWGSERWAARRPSAIP
ncbi:MAG: sulfatase-like hydrolase/transferase [Novosphingobium sp.]